MSQAAEDPWFRRAQDSLAHAIGVRREDREPTVAAMLHREPSDAPSYWLQILLAMGIATLGLVLGSTGVVIGAMLISPLMSPIVALGMGLAIGSPFLVLRGGARVVASIGVVVGTSALLTWLLPFHELTAEMTARTAPNLLDLMIASFCALAAAFTTVRSGAGTSATAAGTAIGISLVPPLCVVGYGLGAGMTNVALGAALLFTANLSAIVLFGSLAFVLLGYGRVNVSHLEAEALGQSPSPSLVRWIAGALQRAFHPPWGSLLRLVMPIALLGAVFVPLKRALTEVSWQVRVRGAVLQMLDELPQTTVRTGISVERSGVQVRLLVVGKSDDAARMQRRLAERIQEISGTRPRVEVVSVPDEAMLREVAAMASHPVAPAPAPPEPAARLFERDLHDAFARRWPADAAGELARVQVSPGAELWRVRVHHQGVPLGAAAERLLAQSVSEDLGVRVAIADAAMPVEPIAAPPADAIAWLGRAAVVLERAAALDGARACVTLPQREPADATGKAVLKSLEEALGAWPERFTIDEGPAYGLRISMTPCTPAAAAGSAVPAGSAMPAGSAVPGTATVRPSGAPRPAALQDAVPR